MADNTIVNPFKRGATVVIPAGTPIRSCHPSDKGGYRFAKKDHTVTLPVASNDGWVDTDNFNRSGRGYVVLPQVCWAGSGGYWMYAQVTPELCSANGIDMPAIPTGLSDWYGGGLDVEPSYDTGYCDQWNTAMVEKRIADAKANAA